MISAIFLAAFLCFVWLLMRSSYPIAVIAGQRILSWSTCLHWDERGIRSTGSPSGQTRHNGAEWNGNKGTF